MRIKTGILTIILLLLSCGNKESDPQEQISSDNPIVTAEATEVTSYSALLHGYVNVDLDTYDLNDGELGFILSTSSNVSLNNCQKVIVPGLDYVSEGKYSVLVSGLIPSTKYYYKAYVNMETTNAVGKEKSFSTIDFTYPSAIDMGLSVKWANINLGATVPEEYGGYYAWGETETKNDYSWFSYKWGDYDYDLNLTKYNYMREYGAVDNKTVLEAKDDVAHFTLGGNWRMPTLAEWTELMDNCTLRWKYENGVFGSLITSKKNGNSIFLPHGGHRYNNFFYRNGDFGYYWSSSIGLEDPGKAYSRNLGIHFYINDISQEYRYYGFSVRPVSE